MNRRQFLSIATAVTAVGMVHLATPRLFATSGLAPILHSTFYRGTKGGKLYESIDRGETWQLIADFGSHCAIDRIVVQKNGDTVVKLVCAGYIFNLHSKDARVWHTV